MRTGREERHQSRFAAVGSAVEAADAVGFLQVDRGRTPSRRYLTCCLGPDRETALVFVPAVDSGRPKVTYCVPNDATAAFEEVASVDDGIDHEVVGRPPSVAVGQHACQVLASSLGGHASSQRLLVPREIPHDAAVFCQRAGYELQSTAAVDAARAIKTPTERDHLTAVQQAAVDGMARAEAMLARCDHTDTTLVFDGQALTVERLRQAIGVELAAHGVSSVANRRIETPTAPTDELPACEPISIQLAPRGPYGYHAHLTRTLAVDSAGGWERRAHVAVEAGLRAAARHLEPDVDIATIEGEIVAEIGAYGFSIAQSAEGDTQTQAAATVHGVGLSTYEQPTPESESTLREGMIVAVSASVVDPKQGAVRLGTLRAVTAEGSKRLVTSRSSLTPTDRCEDSSTERK